MKTSNKYVMGAILVIIGILMIFGNIGFLDLSWIFRLTWPMIFIAVSAFFFLGYFAKRPDGAGLLVPAGIFLTLGATFFLGEAFSYDLVWPGFIASTAVGLLLLYVFGDRSPGLLVPIGVLMTVTITCLLGSWFNIWDIVWPGFIMAPAVGLFLLYLGGKHESGLLIPIFILTAISVTFFSIFSLSRFAESLKYIGGGVLILAGLVTILKKPGNRGQYNHHDDYGPNPM